MDLVHITSNCLYTHPIFNSNGLIRPYYTPSEDPTIQIAVEFMWFHERCPSNLCLDKKLSRKSQNKPCTLSEQSKHVVQSQTNATLYDV